MVGIFRAGVKPKEFWKKKFRLEEASFLNLYQTSDSIYHKTLIYQKEEHSVTVKRFP